MLEVPEADLEQIAKDLSDAGSFVEKIWAAGLEPDPILTVSEWADAHRVLPQQTSAEPGPYRTDRTPYLREIQDCLSALSDVELVVFMKGAQIGATEAGNNFVGYVIDQVPGPMLYIQPTLELVETASKNRIAPMLAMGSLAEKVSEGGGARSDNTIKEKKFPNGVLRLAGANSAAGLRHMSARFLFADELDGYSDDVGGEGDPLQLARKRTASYRGIRKEFDVSTPTIRGVSRIEREFEKTDQRYYNVPCPHCDHYQRITWDKIHFDKENPLETAYMVCESEDCGERIEEHHKSAMLLEGRWMPTADAPPNVRGYHLSALYSPYGWYSWGEAAKDFLEAKKHTELLRVWVNTVLGETWEESGEAIDDEALMARAEDYPENDDGEVLIPERALFLTGGADVQKDRIEIEVVAWGPGEETWGVEYVQIYGDPDKEELWKDLADFLEKTYPHESGLAYPISAFCIDSRYRPDRVFKFCKGREARRHFPVMGQAGEGRPVVSPPSQKRTGRDRRPTQFFSVGTDEARGIVKGRLGAEEPGPGYCHYPRQLSCYGHEYYRQLASMEIRIRFVKGVPVREWHLRSGRRKEAFDCRVYSLAARYLLKINWERLKMRRQTEAEELGRPTPEVSQRPKTRPIRRKSSGSGWVSGWKKYR